MISLIVHPAFSPFASFAGKVMGKKFFRDWKDLNDNWGKAVERNVGRKQR